MNIEARLAVFQKDLTANQEEAFARLHHDVAKALTDRLSDLARQLAAVKDSIPAPTPPDPTGKALLDQLFTLDQRLTAIELAFERYQAEDRYARTRADIVKVLKQESALTDVSDPPSRRTAAL